jgi:hypothetical protein
MLAASENNLISDSDPKDYIPELLKGHEDGDAVLASNLIPKSSALDYTKVSYKEFLDARGKILATLAAELCEGGARK